MTELDDDNSPGILHLFLHKGDSFHYAVEYQNNDGGRFNLGTYDVTWTFDVHGVLLTATEANGKITVFQDIIYLDLTSGDTNSIPGSGTHNLKITSGSEQETLLQGDVMVSA